MEDPIMELLKKTEQECLEAEKTLRQLKEKRDHLRAAAAVTGELTIPVEPRNGVRTDSTMGMAERVLRGARKELHANEIADLILKEFGIRVKKTSIGSQLWKSSQKPGSPFYRSKAAANTFGLRESRK